MRTFPWTRRYAEGGEEGLLDQRAFNSKAKVDERFKTELERILLSVPTEFGWQRTNWTRELLSLELERRGLPCVAACTMGRTLSAIGARLRMPKPTVRCPWDSARRERVLANLRRLALNATAAEPVFYEDEMDVHLGAHDGRACSQRPLSGLGRAPRHSMRPHRGLATSQAPSRV